ncbi:MAG TPA: hypothetical protein VFP84_04720 [Kofleriaceae bacterium]|nr:hypothetical protein [Kofleriaceae bacterium]
MGVLACGVVACGGPDEPTDLRPAGPPEVLAVLISNDASGAGVDERATFCKLHDAKRPALVVADPDGPAQVCPDDLALGVPEADDAAPGTWYVRVQFDELLDPDRVETLVPIAGSTGAERGTLADTRPVTLTCGGAVIAYDGYYNPGGNSLTWPVGPSLYVAPLAGDAIATGTACELALAPAVVDKDGAAVPAAERGPYRFRIAPLALASTAPLADAPDAPAPPTTIAATSPATLTFNAAVDPASLPASALAIVEVADCAADPATGTPHPAVIAGDALDRRSLVVRAGDAADGAAWLPGKTFRISAAPGATVRDVAGGEGPLAVTICFATAP